MKKLILFSIFISFVSCSKTPSCESKEVLEMVASLWTSKRQGIGYRSYKDVKNVRTMGKDNTSKSCDCEATIDYASGREDRIFYTAQYNSEGELYVEYLETRFK